MLWIMLQMVILVGIGTLWQRYAPSHIPSLSHRRALTDLVFYVLLPALVLQVMWQAPLNIDSIRISLTALFTLGLSLGCIFLYTHFLRMTSGQRGALLLAATFPNVTYLGLPVTSAMFGPSAQATVLKYDLLACTPILLTVGILIAHKMGQTSTEVHPIRELLKVPPLWALVIAILFNVLDISQPQLFQQALQTLAGGVVPLMLIALGMSIRWDKLQPHSWRLLIPVCLIALVITPCIAFVTTYALGLTGESRITTILLAAMPTMIFGIVICERYRLDGELYASAVFVTSVLSIFTLPAWYHLLMKTVS